MLGRRDADVPPQDYLDVGQALVEIMQGQAEGDGRHEVVAHVVDQEGLRLGLAVPVQVLLEGRRASGQLLLEAGQRLVAQGRLDVVEAP